MHSPSEPSDAWLTPESRALLRALAERDLPADAAANGGGAVGGDGMEDAGQLARLLCADVRARGGSAVDLVLALKDAWASVPRADSAQRRRASARLSRIVTLCIDAYYAAQRDERGDAEGRG